MTDDYMTLELCRIYSCTPRELDRQPAGVVMAHWLCRQAEIRHEALEAKRSQLRPRRR